MINSKLDFQLTLRERQLIIEGLNSLNKTNEVKTLIDKFSPKEIKIISTQIENKLKELGFKEYINTNPDTKTWGKNIFHRILFKKDLIYIPNKMYIFRMYDKFGYELESLNDLLITLKEYNII